MPIVGPESADVVSPEGREKLGVEGGERTNGLGVAVDIEIHLAWTALKLPLSPHVATISARLRVRGGIEGR